MKIAWNLVIVTALGTVLAALALPYFVKMAKQTFDWESAESAENADY